jgi:UDP-N-acetylglucosamine 1-carboxyvinyltransferase
MDKIRIEGGVPLTGTIAISGAKNAALPLMVASLLTGERLTLSNLPHLADTSLMAALLANHGVKIGMDGNGGKGGEAGRVLSLEAEAVTNRTAPYDLVRKMRASFLVLGPLLARFGEARVSQPGGCAIGTRPVDLHIKGLEALGAEIALEDGYVMARAPRGLKGGRIECPFVSVGATENLIMAASLARGETLIENAAQEPEIADLARCLIAMGAKIDGAGTRTIHVQGVHALHGASHEVLPDRIEAGTYAMAAAVTGGDVTLRGARADCLQAVLDVLQACGVSIDSNNEGLRVSHRNGRYRPADVVTEPFPGFPTDLQAQFMALMATADGESRITETIFENRFMHVPELCRMGAEISVTGRTAHIRGVPRLKGAPVMATDLRASVSLVLAALGAEGTSIVNRVYHLDRGFERLEEKLSACGARIERIKG